MVENIELSLPAKNNNGKPFQWMMKIITCLDEAYKRNVEMIALSEGSVKVIEIFKQSTEIEIKY
ncbi:MAG: hypothetical protein ABIQ07_05920 [Ginsengibacter sp.]